MISDPFLEMEKEKKSIAIREMYLKIHIRIYFTKSLLTRQLKETSRVRETRLAGGKGELGFSLAGWE